jgi:ketosteroid isomerase-like protein
MEFGELMEKMVAGACAGDGEAVASCFTEDGFYDDVFYGAFEGRAKIAGMIRDYFHRDARNFRWDLHDPVSDGKTGYVRYVFSYESKIAESEGTRTMFEGVAVVTLSGGLISLYKEVANSAPGLRRMGFDAERLARFVEKQGAELAARDESQGHL